MKKLIALLFMLTLFCAALPSFAEDTAAPRILVAYLSRAGENYNVGEPREGSASAAYAGYIEKGNTAVMAALIAELTGGDLFEITTVTPYPEDYASMLQVAQEEIDTDARPELAAAVENMAEGSGQSGTQSVITDALPDCIVLQGLAIQGKTAQEDEARTRQLLSDWLHTLNLAN